MGGYYNEGVLYEWDEDRDMALLDKYKAWICDRKETVRCFTPFDLWMIQHNYDNHGIPYGANYFSDPDTNGCDWRLKDGWLYVTSIPTSEEEKKERAPRMKERIAPWIEDFGREYQKGVDELMERHRRLADIDMEKLADWELKDAFNEWTQIYRREANLHFVWMHGYCLIYAMFEEMCKEVAGIDRNDRLFNDLMAGFDHKMIETDRRLFALGKEAKEAGLEPLFNKIEDDEELLSKLEGEEQGREWIQRFRNFLNEFGWRTIGNWDASNPTWVEKPSMVVPTIRRYMAQDSFAVDEARQGLIKAREKAEKEVLSRVPEGRREEFTKLMRSAQWAGVVAEEHVFYAENWGEGLGRHVTREIGKRFAKAGTLDDPQDIYFMLPEEIDPRIINKYPAKKMVKERKKQHIAFRAEEPEPFIGDPSQIPEVIGNNPILRTAIAPNPRVRPELKADLYGTVSTPGVVEGVVNLIMSEDDFDKFEPGSILVTIETSATWTPLFNTAKAVVTDVGGILSHSAVLGREYGLTVISGTIEGTRTLKTGMKVKVDGNAGAIYILDK